MMDDDESSSENVPLGKVGTERTRIRRISQEQRDAMLQYLKKHPKLIKGKGKTPEEFYQKHESWTELAAILNSIQSGPKKTADRWLKSFQDWKCDVKSKQHKLKREDQHLQEVQLLQLLRDVGDADNDPLQSTTYQIDIEPLVKRETSEQLSSSSSDEDTPHHKRRRRRNHRDENADKEDRAIKAMEKQAQSLEKMANAVERIADAVVSALDRFSNRPY